MNKCCHPGPLPRGASGPTPSLPGLLSSSRRWPPGSRWPCGRTWTLVRPDYYEQENPLSGTDSNA
jgi:hypothetical protein